MNIGERYKVRILDLNRDSDGVSKYDGAVIFIPNALPGDEVEVEITEKKKNYFNGRITELFNASEDRIKPVCPYAEECSGCSFQELKYTAELELKKNLIKNNLEKMAGIKKDIEILGSPKTEGYRNKITLKLDERGLLGYFKRGSKDHCPIEDCPIAQTSIRNIIPKIQKVILKHKEIFDAKTNNRYPIVELIIRTNKNDELMIITGSKAPNFYGSDSLYSELKSLPRVVSVYQRDEVYQKRKFKEHKYALKHGDKKLKYYLGNLEFEVSPESFTQVNNTMTEVLYTKALEFIKREHSEYLLDLFCGIGTTTCFFASGSVNLYGIEISRKAIKDAEMNAKRNGLDNILFKAADANRDTMDIIHNKKPDTVVLDPPRAGIDKMLIENLITSTTKRIIYISCDPATLSRDIKLLTDGGFAIEEIVGVDMFPRTMHIECVIGMQRKDT